MATVYLGLGSNLGNKRKQLIIAGTLLAERAGDILALSGFYETEPWGYQSAHAFLNAAVKLETMLSPLGLLAVTQQIEHELGRISKKEKTSYSDRTIDIDLLMYDDLIMQAPELVLPHPLMSQRLFVLVPLAEIAPNLKHPEFDLTISDLLKRLIG